MSEMVPTCELDLGGSDAKQFLARIPEFDFLVCRELQVWGTGEEGWVRHDDSARPGWPRRRAS